MLGRVKNPLPVRENAFGTQRATAKSIVCSSPQKVVHIDTILILIYWEFARRINIDFNSCATHRTEIPKSICMSDTLNRVCMLKMNTRRYLISLTQDTYRVCYWSYKKYFPLNEISLGLYVWKLKCLYMIEIPKRARFGLEFHKIMQILPKIKSFGFNSITPSQINTFL